MARRKTEQLQQETQTKAEAPKAPEKLTLSNPAELTVQQDRQPEVRKIGKFTITTY